MVSDDNIAIQRRVGMNLRACTDPTSRTDARSRTHPGLCVNFGVRGNVRTGFDARPRRFGGTHKLDGPGKVESWIG